MGVAALARPGGLVLDGEIVPLGPDGRIAPFQALQPRLGRKTVTEWVLPQLRAHADMIDPIAFGQFLREIAAGLDFDVMLEAKGKDLALLRLREQIEREMRKPQRK